MDYTDFTPFRNYLNTIAVLSEQEWEGLLQILQIKKFKKREQFQAAGKRCITAGFILQGCFRSVRDVDGEERTFSFAIEKEFVADYYSIITQKPSEVDIIAVEDSTVVCVDATKFLALFDTSFNWQKIGRQLAEYAACYYSERLVSAFYETPRIRYDKFMASSPELFLRIPHHIIANYLGMTKETLSRLRNPVK